MVCGVAAKREGDREVLSSVVCASSPNIPGVSSARLGTSVLAGVPFGKGIPGKIDSTTWISLSVCAV